MSNDTSSLSVKQPQPPLGRAARVLAFAQAHAIPIAAIAMIVISAVRLAVVQA